MTFQVSDFTRVVRYELRDYFGAIVAFGKARKQKNSSLITIPSPGPGRYMMTCHDDADIAWEIGIEPDMNGIYWFDLGDLVAGFHKAAYLGIKDGDPDVPVLPASITLGPTTFLENMLDSGIGDYSDMFNWYIYDKPSRYPERAEHYRQLLSRYGMADAPDWLTEFGAVYKNTEGPDQTNLSGENQRARCRFVAQSITMALVSGVDKAFYFLIPGIHDPNGEEFGLMYADLSPYPGYIALSAAANMLGLPTYSGRYENPSDKNVEAYVFTVSGMTTLVAWSNEPGELRVPTEKKSIQAADVFGKKRKVNAQDGTVHVPVGPDAVYLLDVGDTVKSYLTGSVPEPSKPHPCHPSRIFTIGYCKLPMGFESDCYLKALIQRAGHKESFREITIRWRGGIALGKLLYQFLQRD